MDRADPQGDCTKWAAIIFLRCRIHKPLACLFQLARKLEITYDLPRCMRLTDNRQEILTRFGRQADRFERRGSTVANQAYVRWAASLIETHPGFVALDVAGGTGLLARSVAPRVKSVIVLDLTPAMLAQGRSAATTEGARNVGWLRGDAKRLPFPDASFDIVMTRFSFHHIPEPQDVMAEMRRVVAAHGQVAVADILSVDSPAAAHEHNRLERLRDPSHVRALTRSEFERLLTDAGLKLVRSDLREEEIDLDEWLALTEPSAEVTGTIRGALQDELNGGPPTGMRPVLRDRLMFTQFALALLGKPL